MTTKTEVELVTQPEESGSQVDKESTLKKLKQLAENSKSSPESEKDEDGFVIPEGKLPIDGNFSTEEVKKLIEIAKEDGSMAENIHVEVLDGNKIGERVKIVEKSEHDGKANGHEKDEKEKSD
ncbi:hypothetical protein EJF18_30784 [Clavispora lusitaniae]|uniref:Uncharacterized protein n=2 Tax=Clavispora lusitaniae TaxID=36911 RepID=A0ACD0WJT2_CLALS|nr:hypothetical protein E0198_002703 [Clavispora lusitaniae]KAF7580233.1 hypothetical protein FOB63_005303 [Clavispora lusitaniae]OVF04310.1 hypothetical protein A9F13_28g00077 [Clavispora lusitaniae]QFZ27797.1 hypothetical protein EJF14_30784 [Clavispora lusitaniae]QFZ32896.1 hypothetical protein EJF16_30784 [Clavispora lusitaniae]